MAMRERCCSWLGILSLRAQRSYDGRWPDPPAGPSSLHSCILLPCCMVCTPSPRLQLKDATDPFRSPAGQQKRTPARSNFPLPLKVKREARFKVVWSNSGSVLQGAPPPSPSLCFWAGRPVRTSGQASYRLLSVEDPQSSPDT